MGSSEPTGRRCTSTATKAGAYHAMGVQPGFSRRGAVDMRVSDRLVKCAVFLGIKQGSRFLPKGTAFIVGYEEHGHVFAHLVTAEHVIVQLQKAGRQLWCRVNRLDGSAEEFEGPNHWYFHPNNEAEPTDVAVAPFNFSYAPFDAKWTPLANAATAEVMSRLDIGVGEPVVAVGLFRRHHGTDRNIPIVRTGNIAMLQGEPVQTRWCGYTKAHLIQLMSIAGLSGSPVFVHLSPFRIAHDKVTTIDDGKQYYLLGLISGHFDLKNLHEDAVVDDDSDLGSINSGIGVVIPVEKIIEAITQPELSESRRAFVMKLREDEGAVPDMDLSEAEAEHRFNVTLKAALNTPPKPRTKKR